MTIEQKALELLNAVRDDRGYHPLLESFSRKSAETEALCRALEAHEAFRQEVSDAVEAILNCTSLNKRYGACIALARFIIAKTDPLVEAAQEVAAAEAKKFGLELKDYAVEQEWADNIRAALEARGWQVGPIVKKEAVNG